MIPPSSNAAQQIMREQLSLAFTQIPFNQMLGLKLGTAAPDHVILNFNMKPELIGNFLRGILHGGVISSVLDMAGGMVVMMKSIDRYSDRSVEDLINIVGKCSTVDLQISYLRPGRGDLFTAKAWLLKNGNKISFTRMELLNQQDALIATASGTYQHS